MDERVAAARVARRARRTGRPRRRAGVEGATLARRARRGAQGETGPQGVGGSETPGSILAKLSTVDGSGSGLDASLLDGVDSTQFLRTTGKAADADELDGINSTGFARLSTTATGLIGFPSIGAHELPRLRRPARQRRPGQTSSSCGRAPACQAVPAGVLLMSGSVQTGNQVHVRLCNVRAVASTAASGFPIRWYAFSP